MTAKEFLNQKQFNPDIDITFEEYHGDNIAWSTQDAMIQYAKYHVEKAINSLVEEASYSDLNVGQIDNISKAYPLSNIK